MTTPSKLPVWATSANRTIEPADAKKQIGWIRAEKPPARWMNWWKNLVYQWILWLSQVFRPTIGFGLAMSWRYGRPWVSAVGQFECIAYSPTLHRWVALADGAASAFSDDGVNWSTTGTSGADSQTWADVCWAPELALFVAVSSSGGTANSVATSADGKTWTTRTTSWVGTESWRGICWAKGLGLLVAVSSAGTNRVMTSPDGITWTQHTAAEANQWMSVCWTGSILVAVSLDGTHRAMVSLDGSTWGVSSGLTAGAWRSIVWAKDLALLVAFGDTSGAAQPFVTSPDAVSWTARGPSIASVTAGALDWSPEHCCLVAVGSGTNGKLMVSNDAIDWAQMSTLGSWKDVSYGETVGFAACGANTTGIGLMVSLPAASTIDVTTSEGTFDPPVGMLGEEMTNSASATTVSSSNVVQNFGSITLTPGLWEADLQFTVDKNDTGTGGMTSDIEASIATANNAIQAFVCWIEPPGVTGSNHVKGSGRLRRRFRVSANTTIYANGRMSFSSGNPKWTHEFVAMRVG